MGLAAARAAGWFVRAVGVSAGDPHRSKRKQDDATCYLLHARSLNLVLCAVFGLGGKKSAESNSSHALNFQHLAIKAIECE